MISPLHHQFEPNRVYEWLPGDTAELYAENWRTNKKLLTKLGYTPDVKIEYNIDKYGFRNQHTQITGSILTLGCSFTSGIGLHNEDIWPTLLGVELRKPVYNASVPGASSDTAFRILNELLKKQRPLAVFCMMPSEDRWEFHMDEKYQNYGPWGSNAVNVLTPTEIRIISELHMVEERNQLNQLKNLLAMQKLCGMQHIPFVHMARKHHNPSPNSETNDWARDLAHSGRASHISVAIEMKKLSLDK